MAQKIIEYRGYKVVRFERPSKNRRFGNLKFWTTEPALHPPAEGIDRILVRDGGAIYAQTRAEMQEIIDMHLDGPRKIESPYGGYTRDCPGCRRSGERDADEIKDFG